MPPEAIQLIVGTALTVFVLSYLIGDNFLYRLAMHILVGVGAAYVVGVAMGQVLYPRLIAPLTSPALDARVFGWFGVLGCVFLIAKLLRRAAWLGNVAVGYMIGVGAGVAIGGAVFGTLAPQVIASTASGLGNLLILVTTVATLIAFTYSRAAWRGPVGWIGTLGRGALYVAFGAAFALVFITGASVLTTWASDIAVGLGIR
ncbi:MAG: hypothetical protein ACRDGG_05055 [Anaerolineae bacterium]